MSESSGNGGRRLLRRRQGRMVAGVCTGVADYFGWDVNLVRLGFGIFSFFYGLGVLAYMIAWVIIPEDGEDSSIAESIMNKRKTPPDPPES